MMRRGLSKNMSEGTIWKQILRFSLPLFFGNVFQLLYSMIDSVIVGQYLGTSELAAVGASNPLINLLIGFFMGMASGAGVLIARYKGEGNDKGLSDSIHTLLAFTLVFSLILTLFGVLFADTLLMMLGTPENVLQPASLFLRIYFSGVITLCLYNTGAGILQATGDSKTPLMYLILSCGAKVVLTFWFVTELKFGITGVAFSTLAAQLISSGGVLLTLIRSKDSNKIYLRKIRFDMEMLGKIVRLGIPSGIQQMIVSFSNVLVQSYVNAFGQYAIAGFSAGSNLNNLMGLPMNSFSLAITTFTSQNLGANRKDRVVKGARTAIIMCAITMIVTAVPAILFAEQSVRWFSNEPQVIINGTRMVQVLTPFYVVLGIATVISGVIRGSGNTKAPMVIFVLCYCVIRQIMLFIFMPVFDSIELVYWSYTITWTISYLWIQYYYSKIMKPQWREEKNDVVCEPGF